jgi:hypothetical protein
MGLRRLTAVVVVAALAAAGCGGDGDGEGDAYADQLREVTPPLAEAVAAVEQLDSGASQEDVESTLGDAEASVQAAIDGLEASSPPADAADANQALIDALNGFKRALAAAKSGGADAIETLKAETEDFNSELAAIRQELVDAGVAGGG